MKTYSTYQEAKIENPELEVFKAGDDFVSLAYRWDVLWIPEHGESGNYAHKCNPADYCMTAEKFLKDGHEFVDGDLILGVDGNVLKLKLKNPSSRKITDDNKRFILRAAALENKESDYDRGMREAMKAIAKSCGRTFAVDVGYADLPELVESMINPVKKPRTRIEYVKVADSIFDLRCFKELALYVSSDGESYSGFKGDERTLMRCILEGFLYRKVETEIDERKEFIEAATAMFDGPWTSEGIRKMFDSGKFKYIGGDDADK